MGQCTETKLRGALNDALYILESTDFSNKVTLNDHEIICYHRCIQPASNFHPSRSDAPASAETNRKRGAAENIQFYSLFQFFN